LKLRSAWARALVCVVLASEIGLAPAATRAQNNCDDEAAQVAAQQQQVADEQAQAESLLDQVTPLAASAPAELLAAAGLATLPGVTPETAASFGAIVAQIGAQIGTWQAANTQTGSAAYLQDLSGQLQTWETQYAGVAPVQAAVPSLVQISSIFSQLEQTVGQVQGDLALLDNFQQQLQKCENDNGSDQAGSGDAGALCSVNGATGNSASECFTLETDAAYAVWEACTEQYFAAEDDAFRTGGDLPANTCDPAWAAAQDAIRQRWGAPQP
jgi:hypothetical protein